MSTFSHHALDDDEFWGDYYRLACQEVDRIRGLVATMSRLSRSGVESASRVPCDPIALAREAATLLLPEAAAAEPDSTLRSCDDDKGALHSLRVRIRVLRAVINAVLNLMDQGLSRLALSSAGD